MSRRSREKNTVSLMISLYCHDLHGSSGNLCVECAALLEYAIARTDSCKFGKCKPVCRNCLVHCYKPEMRDRIRRVMRYSGPRLLWKHPVLSVFHLLDSMKSGIRNRHGS